jgi:hypothetical protein
LAVRLAGITFNKGYPWMAGDQLWYFRLVDIQANNSTVTRRIKNASVLPPQLLPISINTSGFVLKIIS